MFRKTHLYSPSFNQMVVMVVDGMADSSTMQQFQTVGISPLWSRSSDFCALSQTFTCVWLSCASLSSCFNFRGAGFVMNRDRKAQSRTFKGESERRLSASLYTGRTRAFKLRVCFQQ